MTAQAPPDGDGAGAGGGDSGWLLRGSTDPEAIARYYDDWASRYDSELAEWDYRSPLVVAKLLAERAPFGAPVLDAGCGTGLSGRALAAVGFTDIRGIDLSERSLAVARESGIYRSLERVDLNERPLPLPDAAFGAAGCTGVLTYVPDGEGLMRELCRVVRPGGWIAFTQRDDLHAERGYDAMLEKLAGQRLWKVVHRSEPSPYLPGNPEFGDRIRVIYHLCQVEEAG